MRINKLNQQGVTLVELLVVIATSSIVFGSITAFGLNYWTNTAVLQNDEDTLVTRMNTGDFMRNAINSASGMISQNTLADSHVLSPDPSDATGTHWNVIHSVPGTIPMPASGSYTPFAYFNRSSIDTSKNIIMNNSLPYQDDVILYMNGSTKQVLERVLANPSASNNRAKTTCPAAIASNSCPKDVVVATDVASVGVRYFSRSGTTIDYTSAVDANTGNYIGPDFPSVEVVEYTLNLNKAHQLHSGADSKSAAVIRIALRN